MISNITSMDLFLDVQGLFKLHMSLKYTNNNMLAEFSLSG